MSNETCPLESLQISCVVCSTVINKPICNIYLMQSKENQRNQIVADKCVFFPQSLNNLSC